MHSDNYEKLIVRYPWEIFLNEILEYGPATQNLLRWSICIFLIKIRRTMSIN